MFRYLSSSQQFLKTMLLAGTAFLFSLAAPLESTYVALNTEVAVNGSIVFAGNTLGLSKEVNQNNAGTSDAIGAFSTLDTTSQQGTYPQGTTILWQENSSNAYLDIPASATVLYAGLIWSGSYGYLDEDGNKGEDPNIILGPADDPITFITPDNVSHSVSPDSAANRRQNVQNPTVSYPAGNYSRSADVTSLVAPFGAGFYAAGGIPSTVSALDNTHNAAGWTLAVIYNDNTMPTRNLTVFQGCEQASYETNNPAMVSGFCTPPAGSLLPLAGRLFVSAIEGDATKTGDHMEFGATPTVLAQLSGPNNPISNFFCSQINYTTGPNVGLLDTRGTFGNRNAVTPNNISAGRQGYDITSVDISAELVHSQQNGYALGTTTGDDYTINALGIEINVDAPLIKMTKTVNGQTSITSELGSIVHFVLTLQNIGSTTAFDVTFSDVLQEGLELDESSVTLNGNPVVFGENLAIDLGNLAPGNTITTIAFDAQIVENPVPPPSFQNFGAADYNFVPMPLHHFSRPYSGIQYRHYSIARSSSV